MIHTARIDRLRAVFPEITTGEEDMRAGKWREVVGDGPSIAYELGRMLALMPPLPSTIEFALPGLVTLEQYVERTMKELEQCLR